VGTTDTVVDLPDAAVGQVDVGPVGLGTTSATLPGLTVESAEVVRLGPEPEITVPSLGLSATTIETPALELGDTEVLDLPDVELPEIRTAEVPVLGTVTGLLGGGSGSDSSSSSPESSPESSSDGSGSDSSSGSGSDGDSGSGDSGSGDSGSGDSGSDSGDLLGAVPVVGGLLG
ncbi:hypothetical protein I4I77_29145, partial [Pseudonocardia sp. KRD-188]|uniref:hypothetical protein n=1 Tax=Pseudonocardia oceani TaxID=2792013 RepID=UPI001C49CDF8